jgi:hypothetical protein
VQTSVDRLFRCAVARQCLRAHVDGVIGWDADSSALDTVEVRAWKSRIVRTLRGCYISTDQKNVPQLGALVVGCSSPPGVWAAQRPTLSSAGRSRERPRDRRIAAKQEFAVTMPNAERNGTRRTSGELASKPSIRVRNQRVAGSTPARPIFFAR